MSAHSGSCRHVSVHVSLCQLASRTFWLLGHSMPAFSANLFGLLDFEIRDKRRKSFLPLKFTQFILCLICSSKANLVSQLFSRIINFKIYYTKNNVSISTSAIPETVMLWSIYFVFNSFIFMIVHTLMSHINKMMIQYFFHFIIIMIQSSCTCILD